MNAPIPIFRPRVADSARARVLATLDSGWLGYGPECRRLEEHFMQLRGGWALATSSCTSALYLAGRLVRKLASSDAPEVIVPAVTFVSSGVAFAEAGLRPVIADVHPDSLLLDPASAEKVLTPRTRAIVVVHLYGQRSPDLARLRTLADKHGLILIEDCAHRVDLLDGTAPVGDLLCYSFNAIKELPGGEAGLIWGRDVEHESWVRSVSNLGLTIDTMQRASTLRHGDYAFISEPGLKLRSNDVCASLVRGGIETLAACREARREQWQRYEHLLAPLAPAVKPLRRGDDDSFLMYIVKVPAPIREAVRAGMAAAGVATSVHYPSLARHPLLGNKPGSTGCAGQDECVLTLPTFLGLSAEDQSRVADALGAALEAASGSAAARRAVGSLSSL
ncbi:MAG TPA: DegT/DnrJ/EryC1/StrS family aminotransferase [Casimicrobiaceae bacterium]